MCANAFPSKELLSQDIFKRDGEINNEILFIGNKTPGLTSIVEQMQKDESFVDRAKDADYLVSMYSTAPFKSELAEKMERMGPFRRSLRSWEYRIPVLEFILMCSVLIK